MSERSDQLEDAHEKAQLEFTRKVLTDPAGLTREDYDDISHNVADIIRIATDRLGMPARELKQKMVILRTCAAHDRVDITLPTEMDNVARVTGTPPARPGNTVSNKLLAGVARTLERGAKTPG